MNEFTPVKPSIIVLPDNDFLVLKDSDSHKDMMFRGWHEGTPTVYPDYVLYNHFKGNPQYPNAPANQEKTEAPVEDAPEETEDLKDITPSEDDVDPSTVE